MKLALAASLATLIGTAAYAEPASLEGSWSGGGWVAFASGAKEQARCRAQYSRRSKTEYSMRGTCATASGRAAQTATPRLNLNTFAFAFANTVCSGDFR